MLSISVNFCWSYAPFGTYNTRNTQFSALFSYKLWHIGLKFWIWFCFTLLQIKFECRQFLWELCPFWNVENWKYTVFRSLFLHALTYWAEILHLTFTVLEIKFECRQFLSIFVGVMPLLEPRILEYAIFRNFLLHALIYQAEILHMTLFYCTTDQVPMLSISVNFCWSYAPFGT